jgi:hypothetical protein
VYNLRELAGAFGDLGTLIPFLIGYITLSKMDPVGVLVSFGLFKIFAGLYFKTPSQIQYITQDPALIAALHQWFAAQRSDHGHHAVGH